MAPQYNEDEQKTRRAEFPIGTLDEIQQMGFVDPAEYPTCAQSNKEQGILGCDSWKSCPLRGGEVLDYQFGDKVIRGKTGPERLGIQTLSNKSTGRKVLNEVIECYRLPLRLKKAQNSQGSKRSRIVRIIATEGETININTRGPVDEDIPGQGRRRTWHIVKGGLPVVVEPFPRPSANPEIGSDAFAAQEEERFRLRKSERGAQEFFGRVQSEAVKKPKEADGGQDKRAAGPRG